MKHLKKYQQFIYEAYEADVAIEEVLHQAMGDFFLDERAYILDFVYTILGMRTVSVAIDEIIEEYPDLARFRDELITAAKKEGYEDFTKEDWDEPARKDIDWDNYGRDVD